jgi:hypothetical protein
MGVDFSTAVGGYASPLDQFPPLLRRPAVGAYVAAIGTAIDAGETQADIARSAGVCSVNAVDLASSEV